MLFVTGRNLRPSPAAGMTTFIFEQDRSRIEGGSVRVNRRIAADNRETNDIDRIVG
jgi:hypothetical protein